MEEYSFLNDFTKRMKIIGAFVSFAIKIDNSQRFKAYLNRDELINLAIAMLCYLLEKTINRESSSMLELNEFTKSILKDFNKNLDDEVVLDVTRFIVREVFMNNGEYYSFNIFDFEKKKFIQEDYQLLKDNMNSKGDITYNLTSLGTDVLIRTKEIDNHTNVSMKQILTKEFIVRQDFKGASTVARDLLAAVLSQKQEIDDFIERIRTTNVLKIDTNDYKKQVEGIFETLDKQRAETDHIIFLLNESEKEFLELGEYNPKLKDFKITKDLLIIIRKEHSSLFDKRYSVDETYKNALINAMTYGLTKRFDFNEVVMQPLKENVELLGYVPLILKPLFNIKTPKQYNPIIAYAEQEIIKPKEEKEVILGFDLEEDKTRTDKIGERIEDLNKRYVYSIKSIFDICMSKGDRYVTLNEIINTFTLEQKDYLIDNDRNNTFFKVITVLYEENEYLTKDLRLNLVLKDENFNIKNVYTELIETNPVYNKIISFEVVSDTKETLTIVSEIEENRDGLNIIIDRKIKISNYKFKVVCMDV